MPRKRRLNNPKLSDKQVFFTDTSDTSPDIFRITEFPTRLTAGKNIIKLQGNQNTLVAGAFIEVQVEDSNGEPIYNEILNYLEDDGSRVIVFYVYPDTPEGDATITLGTEIFQLNNTIVPFEFQKRVNAIWSKSVPVAPTVQNSSEIIFTTEPTITIEEQISVQLDRSYSGSLQTTTYDIGTVKYIEHNNDPKIIVTGGQFTGDMKNGTLTVSSPINPKPTPNFIPDSTPIYTSKILKVLNDTTLTLETPFTFITSQSLSIQKYNEFEY